MKIVIRFSRAGQKEVALNKAKNASDCSKNSHESQLQLR